MSSTDWRGGKISILLLLLWHKQEYRSCSLADIHILSPSPIPLLSYFIQSLSDGKVNPLILSSREASCPHGNLQGFPWTLWTPHEWEIQICSHISVITYKQGRFSLEEKKTFQKLQVWPDPFLRGVLNQELAHQPLSFACLLSGPRRPYHIRDVSKSPALKGHCHWKESQPPFARTGQKPQNGMFCFILLLRVPYMNHPGDCQEVLLSAFPEGCPWEYSILLLLLLVHVHKKLKCNRRVQKKR